MKIDGVQCLLLIMLNILELSISLTTKKLEISLRSRKSVNVFSVKINKKKIYVRVPFFFFSRFRLVFELYFLIFESWPFERVQNYFKLKLLGSSVTRTTGSFLRVEQKTRISKFWRNAKSNRVIFRTPVRSESEKTETSEIRCWCTASERHGTCLGFRRVAKLPKSRISYYLRRRVAIAQLGFFEVPAEYRLSSVVACLSELQNKCNQLSFQTYRFDESSYPFLRIFIVVKKNRNILYNSGAFTRPEKG